MRRQKHPSCETMKLFLVALFTGGLLISADAQSPVGITLSMLTAPYAAVGASMGYQLVVRNLGTTTITVEQNVELISPDTSTATLLTENVTLAVGEKKIVTATFKTSTYNSSTGAFTLHGYVTDVTSGQILAQQDVALTVNSVPSNLVYASIGGLGPATAAWGSTCDFQTVVANLSSAPLTLTTNTTLILTDGTESPLSQGKASSVDAEARELRPGTATTSQYSSIARTYAVWVDVLDDQSQVIATDTYTIPRTALPATVYTPSFTDSATTAGVNFP